MYRSCTVSVSTYFLETETRVRKWVTRYECPGLDGPVSSFPSLVSDDQGDYKQSYKQSYLEELKSIYESVDLVCCKGSEDRTIHIGPK